MNIEEVDEKFIHKFPVDINIGVTDEIAKDVANRLGVPKNLIPETAQVFFL